jgi:hypothetical protein
MNTSEQINELATALAKAQSQMEGAKKDSANPFFKSKYADLQSVWDACRNALTDNGLSVAQYVAHLDGTVSEALVTRLLHSSGQWIEGVQLLNPKDPSPQAVGSAITYARRYGLAAMVGVYQMDDDADGAHGRPSDPYNTRGGKETKAINEQSKRIIAAIEAGKVSAAVDILSELKDSSEEVASSVWRTLPSDVKNTIRDAQDPRK